MWLRMTLAAALGLSMPWTVSLAGQESQHAELLQGTAHSTRAPHGLERLFGSDVTWGTALTQIYQQNVHGGLSTSARTGRYAGSYDVEASADLESMLGLVDSTMYLLLEGGWPSAGSIDPAAVGSYFGVNGDAIAGEWIDVAELWYLRSFADDRLFIQIGKADLTAGIEYRSVVSAFDLNRYANDENSQFLNGALVNNPTVPFPAHSLALSAVLKPSDRWQIAWAAAAQSVEADIDECATWASDDAGYFLIAQASLTPDTAPVNGIRAGEYHVGGWWTGGGELSAGDERTGVYLSAAHKLFAETDDPEDEQGLGVFGRYGWTDGDAVELEQFWSVGVQYQGFIESRDADVLGVGFAGGRFAGSDSPAELTGSERVLELYYNLVVSPSLSLSPDVQYVADPGGETGADDAFAVALRARLLIE